MSSDLFTSLTTMVQTTDDLRVLEREIEQVKSSIYSTGQNDLSTVLKEKVRMKVAELLTPALSTKPDKAIDEILTRLKQLPILRMRIAFEPTRSTIEHFSEWLAQNTTQHWVMELVVDPEVGGGTILEVNGLYRDFSLKEKMAVAVQQATQRIYTQLHV